MTPDTHADDDTDSTDSATGDTNKPDWWDDLEDGARADAVVDESAERHYIRDDGKRYWFDLREPTWQKKSSITDDALVIKRNERELNTTQYYRDMLEYLVEDASIPVENFATFMAGAKASLADKLTTLVPAPGNNISEDEEGNSEPPSDQDKTEATATTPPAPDTTDA